jgi:hypothetical protein
LRSRLMVFPFCGERDDGCDWSIKFVDGYCKGHRWPTASPALQNEPDPFSLNQTGRRGRRVLFPESSACVLHDTPAKFNECCNRQIVLSVIGAPGADAKIRSDRIGGVVVDCWEQGEAGLVGVATLLRIFVLVRADERPVELFARVRIAALRSYHRSVDRLFVYGIRARAAAPTVALHVSCSLSL